MSFFSFIKITAEGIEQKHSIYQHIRCNWSDVDKIGKLFLFTDVVYLNSYEVIGPSLWQRSPFRFIRSRQSFISLSGYEGWADGQLANDLRHHAPKLFVIQPHSYETGPDTNDSRNKQVSHPSQEIRLLAALSHASVLFSYIGVLIPIGIYATQKHKSSYIGYQALQALILQIVAFVFNLVASSCMVGVIFLPILFASSSQNERILELLGGGMFFLILGSVFPLIFANLAFKVYGVFGAIMTYQGKEFRYVFIGNRIPRSKDTKLTEGA